VHPIFIWTRRSSGSSGDERINVTIVTCPFALIVVPMLINLALSFWNWRQR
jgi:hypothetical protein